MACTQSSIKQVFGGSLFVLNGGTGPCLPFRSKSLAVFLLLLHLIAFLVRVFAGSFETFLSPRGCSATYLKACIRGERTSFFVCLWIGNSRAVYLLLCWMKRSAKVSLMNGRPCLKTRPPACVWSTRDSHTTAAQKSAFARESLGMRKFMPKFLQLCLSLHQKCHNGSKAVQALQDYLIRLFSATFWRQRLHTTAVFSAHCVVYLLYKVSSHTGIWVCLKCKSWTMTQGCVLPYF